METSLDPLVSLLSFKRTIEFSDWEIIRPGAACIGVTGLNAGPMASVRLIPSVVAVLKRNARKTKLVIVCRIGIFRLAE